VENESEALVEAFLNIGRSEANWVRVTGLKATGLYTVTFIEPSARILWEGQSLSQTALERLSLLAAQEGSTESLEGVRQVQVNLLCHAGESRCNRNDEASGEGLFPPHARFFAESILSTAEGLRMTSHTLLTRFEGNTKVQPPLLTSTWAIFSTK
jgi:hypothetical protein